ncbi:MAG TPA: DUF2231 domain-containing protein [Kofleriaceae bacterium]|nr:DUF2231 domain-containing protein [Kofleriaceae bacterium]
MSTRKPIHPLLTALPFATFAVTIVALAGHAVTRDAGWYRVALYANTAGVVVALFALTIGLVDAENLPAYTASREAGLRHVAFEALALVFFAASATVMFVRYETHAALTDAAPLALAMIAGAAMVIAGWYGRALLRLYRLGQAIVQYPARHGTVTPRPPHPRPVPTIG